MPGETPISHRPRDEARCGEVKTPLERIGRRDRVCVVRRGFARQFCWPTDRPFHIFTPYCD